jgi:hypothetical protein
MRRHLAIFIVRNITFCISSCCNVHAAAARSRWVEIFSHAQRLPLRITPIAAPHARAVWILRIYTLRRACCVLYVALLPLPLLFSCTAYLALLRTRTPAIVRTCRFYRRAPGTDFRASLFAPALLPFIFVPIRRRIFSRVDVDVLATWTCGVAS